MLARVQRLTRDGYILGYEARLNPLKLGAGMMVFVEVLLDRTTPNVFEAFKAAVQVHDEIAECHMVAGGFDYLLKTRMADMQAYRNFAGTVLWQLPGVRDAHLCGDGRSEEHDAAATGLMIEGECVNGAGADRVRRPFCRLRLCLPSSQQRRPAAWGCSAGRAWCAATARRRRRAHSCACR